MYPVWHARQRTKEMLVGTRTKERESRVGENKHEEDETLRGCKEGQGGKDGTIRGRLRL